LFARHIAAGDGIGAGRLMSIGHDGDRVNWTSPPSLSDDEVERWASAHTPVHEIPGVFSASTPVLDGLVDCAIREGAYGASLTGAGLGGSVLALCPAGKSDTIADAIARYVASDAYARAAETTGSWTTPSIVGNTATLGAGELIL